MRYYYHYSKSDLAVVLIGVIIGLNVLFWVLRRLLILLGCTVALATLMLLTRRIIKRNKK